mmetsp:Transcript_33237/g.91586  ORF Transcript_33237/g.91586 Transcript_33237/m.91586 type:complete len:323 (+) Transcript_33237:80-1048(+)
MLRLRSLPKGVLRAGVWQFSLSLRLCSRPQEQLLVLPRCVVREFSVQPPLPPVLGGAAAPFSTDTAMDQLVEKGVAQGLRPTSQILASSFLGGAMLAWGGLLMTVVGGGCADIMAPGAVALIKGAVFPVGLSMITLSGSELLTGNMLTQSLPPISGERAWPAGRVLGLSFLGNFAGSLTIASMVWAGGIFPTSGVVAAKAAALALGKASLAPSAAFVKGIGANWLVAIAIVQAQSAHTAPGKIAALWMPIMTFVALGLEHSVANMFLLPVGMLCGAEISASQFWLNNMIPVLAGNMVGAVVFCGGAQRLTMGRQLKDFFHAK